MSWLRILAIMSMVLTAGGELLAAEEAVYDIPRLDGIQIDGKADDWGERGFRVDGLAEDVSVIRPRKDFASKVRLGWNDQGLLILVGVTDPKDVEAESTDSIYDGACVEFFMSRQVGDRDVMQMLVAPGVSAKFPRLRKTFGDMRDTPELKAIPLDAQVQRTKTSDGYQMEALMPWKMLGITPAMGREIGFQIYVDNVDANQEDTCHAMWYPKVGVNKNRNWMETLRLSDHASPPAPPAVWGAYENFRDARFNVVGSSELAGMKVEIRQENGDAPLAAGTIQKDAEWATASLTLPMPPRGHFYPPLAVTVQGQPTTIVDLGDPESGRADAIARLTIAFAPAVFSGQKFPPFDFTDPASARGMLGPYTLKARFYDRKMNEVESAATPGRYGAIVEITTEGGQVLRRFETLYCTPKPLDSEKLPDGNARALVDAGIDPAICDHFAQYIVAGPQGDFDRKPPLAVLLSALSETAPGETRVYTGHWNPYSIDDDYWYALQKKTNTFVPYPYLSYLPAAYEADGQKKWPLLIVLHGAAGRGDDLEMLAKRHEVPSNLVSNLQTLPFVVIGPQCPRADWWRSRNLVDLIDRLQEKYRIDPDRIYVIGFSMGGFGTWDLGMTIPERLAAIAPAAGGADPADAPLLKDLPVWIWHGDHDPSVKFENSTKMFAALSAIGARTRFTVVAGGVHDNDTAYGPELYHWLLEQTRGKPMQGATTQPMVVPVRK